MCSAGPGLGVTQGARSCLHSQLQAQSMALPEVTQQDRQLETHIMDPMLPALSRPRLESGQLRA